MRTIIVLVTIMTVGCQMATKGPSVPPTRTFHISYEAQLDDLTPGQTLKLWIPVPSNDPHQVIRNLEVDAPWPTEIHTEPVHGNRMVFLEGTVVDPSMTVTVSLDVDRWENTVDLDGLAPDGVDKDATFSVYTKPSTLGIIDDEVRGIAHRAARGKPSTVAKARAFYDHVGLAMIYDKSGQGWGRGDTAYACSVGRGNCTDYHSYFISLCQSVGIPARFQIGLYGPYETSPGETTKTGGYHCWAEFRVPGRCWVPVDISEGDKDPARWEAFFGSHTDNRVTFSTGRDLMLEPKQNGPARNYFVNPYAEVDGKPYENVSKVCHWTDAGSE